MIAKEVMPGKFWIVEDPDGQKKGTLQASPDGKINAVLNGKVVSYSDWQEAKRILDLKLPSAKEEEPEVPHEVHGYPTSCRPHNPVWDMKKKLPLFTKTEKSRSLYAAGYYIIKFDHGWVQSHCPKLTTLNNNEFQGPFVTKLEMRERLRLADD